MNNEVDIYVLTYQKSEFDMILNDTQKILQVGAHYNEAIEGSILDNSGINISEKNPLYSELTGYYWIWKNAPKNKYIGVEHPRRHLCVDENDIPKLIEKHGIIVPYLSVFSHVNEHIYNICHDKKTLSICEQVFKRLHPEMASTYDNIIKNGKSLLANNTFITSHENFTNYCEFLFTIFDEFEKEMGFKNLDEWRNYVIENSSKDMPKYHNDLFDNVSYQLRIFGFLAERLFTVWVAYNFKIPYFAQIERLDWLAKSKKTKTLLCCIGRQENQYIREYVEYYKNLGVSNICLFDNNYDGEEDFNDVIGDYIDSGFVILKDYRNRKNCQLDAYNECYQTYGDKYDWIMFFDIDEFLELKLDKSINYYLCRDSFSTFDAILINWLTYDDNDLVYNDKRGVLERFTRPMDLDKCVCYEDIPENHHVKTIVRGGLKDVNWNFTSHKPRLSGKFCNNVGIPCTNKGLFYPYDYRYCSLKHFSTKTAEEFSQKIKRGFADKNLVDKDEMLKSFFTKNNVTKEKIEVFERELGVNLSHFLPKDKIKKSDDVKIYSLCYKEKDFEFLDDAVITPLQVGADNGTNVCELKDNTLDNISDKNFFFIENTGTYWIWKNVNNCKYKGQMQYRRPLVGVSEEMDFDEIFSKYDVITCEPFHHPSNKTPTEQEQRVIVADTVEEGYGFSHCVDDILIMELIIKTYFPDYVEDWNKYIKNGPNLYYSNGFIMKADDFDAYCEFLFTCLNTYMAITEITNKNDLINHVKYNLEVGKYPRFQNINNVPAGAIEWQCAIGGFLSERLWTLWVQHNFSDEKILKLPYQKMEESMYT